MLPGCSPYVESVPPTTVWEQLTPHCQIKIIRLLAQLTFNLVLAQSEPSSFLLEANDVISPHQTQDPT